jgi:hypothetical protein
MSYSSVLFLISLYNTIKLILVLNKIRQQRFITMKSNEFGSAVNRTVSLHSKLYI